MEENPVHYPCLIYEKAVKMLFKKVKKAKTLVKVRYLFIEFNQKYTVIDSVWRSWGREELKEVYKDYDENKVLNRIENIKKVALLNFYLWDCLNFSSKTFTEGKFGRTFFWHFLNNYLISSNFDPLKAETLIEALIYPHDRLKDIYYFAKKRLNYPMPKKLRQKYKNAKNEYEKIGVNLPFYSNYSSDKQLFIDGLKNYANFGQKLIVIENFECGIGLFPCKKEIWKMYFDYLKIQKEEKRLLNLYSRFCRFFIDDLEIQNQYCIELEKQSLEGKNVAKWWIDLAEIVKDFVGIDSGRGILERALKCSKQESLIKYGLWFEKEYGTIDQNMTRYLWSIKIHPNLKNLHNIVRSVPNLKTVIKFNHKIDYQLIDKPHKYLGATFMPRKIFQPKSFQSFPFRSSIMSYVEKYANYTVSLKLFQSAKYFFFLKKSPFCHNLTILNENENENDRLIFNPHSLFFTPSYIDYSTPNFTVTNGIFIFCKNSPNLFSKIIPKMDFKIKHLILTNQILNFHDFEFIIELKLESVKFDKVIFYKDDHKIDELSIDEIISMLDGVKDLSLLQIPSNSPLHLNKIQRTIKLKVFEISQLNEHFYFYDFVEFAKKNVRKNAKIILHFTETVTKEQKQNFDEIMQNEFPDVKFYNK